MGGGDGGEDVETSCERLAGKNLVSSSHLDALTESSSLALAMLKAVRQLEIQFQDLVM